MKRSSAGVDGWDATLLSHLPPEGWDRLAQLLNRCEEKSEWPTSLKVWKLVFIPKGKSDSAQTATDALQVRPIAVGSLIYRLWGKVRLQQLAPHLTNHLAPFQSGGNAGPDVESMLVWISLVTHINMPWLSILVRPLTALTPLLLWKFSNCGKSLRPLLGYLLPSGLVILEFQASAGPFFPTK